MVRLGTPEQLMFGWKGLRILVSFTPSHMALAMRLDEDALHGNEWRRFRRP